MLRSEVPMLSTLVIPDLAFVASASTREHYLGIEFGFEQNLA